MRTCRAAASGLAKGGCCGWSLHALMTSKVMLHLQGMEDSIMLKVIVNSSELVALCLFIFPFPFYLYTYPTIITLGCPITHCLDH